MKKRIGGAVLLLLCLGAFSQTEKKGGFGTAREVVESKDAPKPNGPY
jgi:hypothetical protein